MEQLILIIWVGECILLEIYGRLELRIRTDALLESSQLNLTFDSAEELSSRFHSCQTISDLVAPLRTESALLWVFNDIILANDFSDGMILVLQDLTASFDTVDQNIYST